MDVEQFKQDVREGRIEVARLVELIVTLQRELQAARRRIEELERKHGGSGSAKVAEPFFARRPARPGLHRPRMSRTTDEPRSAT